MSSPLTALSSADGGLGACLRKRLRRSPIGGVGLRRGRLQRLELFFAGIDQRDIAVVLLRQRRKLVDRNVVFAAGGAQAEQPLLDALELGRIEIGGAQCRFKMTARLIERRQRGIERLDGRFDQARRLRHAPFEPPDHARERRHAGFGAGDDIVRIAQVFRDLLGLHHRGTTLGECGLFAGLRRKLVEFIDGMAQPVALAFGPFDFGTMGIGGGLRLAPGFP